MQTLPTPPPAADQVPSSHPSAFDPDYLAWRSEQLAQYDRDYAAWRLAQIRRHDEQYLTWRRNRSAKFELTVDTPAAWTPDQQKDKDRG